MKNRTVAVVGCPRSGTRYVHWMLRAAGLDVWHERMGPDGTVSGLFVFPHSYAPGGHRGDGDRPQDYAFAHRYALIRDPQRTIPSLAQVFQHGDFEAYFSAKRRLFEPFSRGSEKAATKGLGLGLYIVSEIARAHGGAINVNSSAQQTRFTFRMPAG